MLECADVLVYPRTRPQKRALWTKHLRPPPPSPVPSCVSVQLCLPHSLISPAVSNYPAHLVPNCSVKISPPLHWAIGSAVCEPPTASLAVWCLVGSEALMPAPLDHSPLTVRHARLKPKPLTLPFSIHFSTTVLRY